jgi:hypothetical protein
MTCEEIIAQIERELTLFMGPLAPVIMRDKAVEFGKKIDDFPKEKIAELVEEISFEIQNNLKKIEFQRAALRILREASQEAATAEESHDGPRPIRLRKSPSVALQSAGGKDRQARGAEKMKRDEER